jgi:hypothetical protein
MVHKRSDIIQKLLSNGNYKSDDPIAIIRAQRATDRNNQAASTKSYSVLSGIETSLSKQEYSQEENTETLTHNEDG